MLKSGNTKAIQRLFNRLNSEAESIIREIVELVWYMRGSVQYHDMLNTTVFEREIMNAFLSDRMEAIKKHSFPVY